MTRAAPGPRRILLAGCVALFVCASGISHMPLERMPELPASDKTLHIAGFFVLAAALMASVLAYGLDRCRRLPLAVAILATYGLLDEITQPWFNRCADIWDLAADMAGALVAIVLWEILWTLRKPSARAKSPTSPPA